MDGPSLKKKTLNVCQHRRYNKINIKSTTFVFISLSFHCRCFELDFSSESSPLWRAGTLRTRSALDWMERVLEAHSPLPPTTHPQPHCCAPESSCASDFNSTSIWSTFCSPLKEIGFKRWHKLAPRLTWYCHTQGMHHKKNQKKKPTFPPRFLSVVPFTLCPFPFVPPEVGSHYLHQDLKGSTIYF